MANTASSTRLEEVVSTPVSAATTNISVAALVGTCERGPIGVRTRVNTWGEYQAIFGDHAPGAGLPAQVLTLFEEAEGRGLVDIVRTVHYGDPAVPSSKTSSAAVLALLSAAGSAVGASAIAANPGPYDLEPGQTIVASVSGGGDLAATFNATSAERESVAEPFDLTNNDPLTWTLNGVTQPAIVFLASEVVSIDAVTAEEAAAIVNAKVTNARAILTAGGTKFKIVSDRRGTSSGINITGGAANTAFGFTTGNISGTGNVADIDIVTQAEAKTVLDAAITGTTTTPGSGGAGPTITTTATGGSATLQIKNTSTAVALGFPNAVNSGSSGVAGPTADLVASSDGVWARSLSVLIGEASSGLASEFNLTVLRNGYGVEPWPNLSMDPNADRFIETVLNSESFGSRYIRANALTTARPVNGTSALFSGGSDGLANLVAADFLGAIGSNGERTGLEALTHGSPCMVGIPEQPTALVGNAILSWAVNPLKKAMAGFAVLGVPANLSAAAFAAFVDASGLVQSSEFGCMAWPEVTIPNPNKTVYGRTDNIVISNVGAVMGRILRTDRTNKGAGFYLAPAGAGNGVFRFVNGLANRQTDDITIRNIIAARNVNSIVVSEDNGIYINDSFVLRTRDNFPSIPERRGVIYIEQAMIRTMELFRQMPNDDDTRAALDRIFRKFLNDQTALRAFRTSDPATAYFFDCGRGVNSDADIFEGRLIAVFAPKTNKPIKDAILRVTQDVRPLLAA